MPMGEWKKQTPDFHLDPKKEGDPVEKLIQEIGPENALEKLTEQIKNDPSNPELRRQANLLLNRVDDLTRALRDRVSH